MKSLNSSFTNSEYIAYLEGWAKEIGMNLDYYPEVAVEDIEKITYEEWLRSRQSGIGGSDAGAVMGVSSFATPLNVYLSKTTAIDDGELDPDTQFRFDYGHALESSILKWYGRKFNIEVFTDRHQYRHPLYPFMLGDMDGFARDKEGTVYGIEIKTTSPDNKYFWSDGVYPEAKCPVQSYVYQVYHYMAVMNLPRVDLVVCFSNNAADMKVITFYRDMNMEKYLIDSEQTFWEKHVMAGIMPEATALSDAQLSRAGKLLIDFPCELSLSDEPKMKLYLEYESQIESLKQQQKNYEQEQNGIAFDLIRKLGGENEIRLKNEDGVYTVAFKGRSSNRLDTTSLKKAFPVLAQEFTVLTRSEPKFSLKFKANH